MSRHLKRMAAPKSWPIPRGGSKYVTKSLPGPHSLETGMPLNMVLKDMLKLAKTSREVKTSLNDGKIKINGIIRKEPKFNVGIFDVVNADGIGNYRMLYDHNGRLRFKETKDEDKRKLVKITGKRTLAGKIIQLNFFDGTNLLVSKDTFKTGDSLMLEGKNVVKHLKFEKGANIYLIGGKHVGKLGVLEDVRSFKGIYPDKITLDIKNEKAETLKKYAVVVDSNFENE